MYIVHVSFSDEIKFSVNKDRELINPYREEYLFASEQEADKIAEDCGVVFSNSFVKVERKKK